MGMVNAPEFRSLNSQWPMQKLGFEFQKPFLHREPIRYRELYRQFDSIPEAKSSLQELIRESDPSMHLKQVAFAENVLELLHQGGEIRYKIAYGPLKDVCPLLNPFIGTGFDSYYVFERDKPDGELLDTVEDEAIFHIPQLMYNFITVGKSYKGKTPLEFSQELRSQDNYARDPMLEFIIAIASLGITGDNYGEVLPYENSFAVVKALFIDLAIRREHYIREAISKTETIVAPAVAA